MLGFVKNVTHILYTEYSASRMYTVHVYIMKALYFALRFFLNKETLNVVNLDSRQGAVFKSMRPSPNIANY